MPTVCAPNAYWRRLSVRNRPLHVAQCLALQCWDRLGGSLLTLPRGYHQTGVELHVPGPCHPSFLGRTVCHPLVYLLTPPTCSINLMHPTTLLTLGIWPRSDQRQLTVFTKEGLKPHWQNDQHA